MTERKPGTFVKGDARINRKGRPKNFDALRAFVLEVGNEVLTDAAGKPITTRFQAIIRDWLSSGDFKKQQAILEIAFGKVPMPVELSGKDGGSIEVEYVNSPYPASDVSPEPGGDTPESQ